MRIRTVQALWRKYKGPVLYLVFGGVTTAVNVAVYSLCYDVLALPNVPSVVISWVLSVAVAYLTNKLWVFASKSFAPKVLWPELARFVTARAFTGLLDLGVMFVGVDLLRGPGTPIKLGSNLLVIVLNYVFSKWLIFRGGEEKTC